jgi:hypothetical protein
MTAGVRKSHFQGYRALETTPNQSFTVFHMCFGHNQRLIRCWWDESKNHTFRAPGSSKSHQINHLPWFTGVSLIIGAATPMNHGKWLIWGDFELPGALKVWLLDSCSRQHINRWLWEKHIWNTVNDRFASVSGALELWKYVFWTPGVANLSDTDYGGRIHEIH